MLFAHSCLGPLVRLFETELRAKLESPGLSLDMSDLRAADVMNRAAAFRKMVEGGMETGRRWKRPG